MDAWGSFEARHELQDWESWFQSPERLEIQTKIDLLLQTPTEYAIYDYA